MSFARTARATAAAMALGLAAALPVSAENLVLTYTSYIANTHPVNADAILPWAEEVAKVTEGRVRIEALPKMVGTAPAQHDVIAEGLADVAWFTPGYTPGRFAALELAELPFIADDPEVGAIAMQRWFEKYFADGQVFKEVHPLAIMTTSAGTMMSKKPVSTVEDLKGLKVRSPLPITLGMLNTIGAVPVQKPGNEAYELLAAGTLDASLSGAEQAVTFKLGEVTKQMLMVPGGFYNSVCGVIINKDKWARISEADRAAITAISGEKLSRAIGKSFLGPIEEAKTMMSEGGRSVDIASDEMVAELKTAWAGVEAEIIAKAEASGVQDAAALLADLRAMVAEVQKEIR